MGSQDNHRKVPLASIFGKRLDLAFDGGILTSDSGALLLREVEAKSGILSRISDAIRDRRHKSYVTHAVSELVKQRVFQIACGYEDGNDCDALRSDPGIKAACGVLPLSGADLSACNAQAGLGSQPTMSRFENQIRRSDLYRIARAFVDCFIASYKKPPEAIILPACRPAGQAGILMIHRIQFMGASSWHYSMAITMPTPISPCIFMRGKPVS